jgi:hypothetical protein
VHFNLVVLRAPKVFLNVELISFRISGDLEEGDSTWPQAAENPAKDLPDDRWRVVLKQDHAIDDVDLRERVECLEAADVSELDVIESLFRYLDFGQFDVRRRDVARGDHTKSACQPEGNAADAAAEFQAGFELRSVHSIVAEPGIHALDFAWPAVPELRGVGIEIGSLESLVAQDRPERLAPALFAPTALDPLKKTLRCRRVGLDVHSDRHGPIDIRPEWRAHKVTSFSVCQGGSV